MKIKKYIDFAISIGVANYGKYCILLGDLAEGLYWLTVSVIILIAFWRHDSEQLKQQNQDKEEGL